MVDALIMAGGESKRMRAGGDTRHKALAPVLGISLIERNLRYVITAGFGHVAVSVSRREPALISFVQTVGQSVAKELGATCTLVIEETPLGTIGAAREVDACGPLLVVNVDNLTDLSLANLRAHHVSTMSELTIAAHRHALPLDFGEIVVEGGEVVAYREKPVRYPLISSGTYMLSRAILDCINPGESVGIPALFMRAQHRGLRCVPFEHDGFWIDINDRRALADAESMLRASGESA